MQEDEECEPERVDGEEFIIRRIPPGNPGFDTTMFDENGKERATSATLGLRPGEAGLSCSRFKITTPSALLAQIGVSLDDGWKVCCWKVCELPVGVEVLIVPTDPPELEPGHCEIRPLTGKNYNNTKIAKASRVLSSDEVKSGMISS